MYGGKLETHAVDSDGNLVDLAEYYDKPKSNQNDGISALGRQLICADLKHEIESIIDDRVKNSPPNSFR